MSCESRKKLRVMLVRDSISFILLLGFFYVPGSYGGVVLVVACLAVTKFFWKSIRGNPVKLERSDRHIYFAVNVAYLLVLLALLIAWAARHPNSAAWYIAGVGVIGLLVAGSISANMIYRRDTPV
jgi:hypothetical protein